MNQDAPTPEVRAFAAARYRLLNRLDATPYSLSRTRVVNALSFIDASETMNAAEKTEHIKTIARALDAQG